MDAVDDKKIVREYFNATGFDRWRRIYGDGEVNKVQLDIRTGHQQTVDTVLGWLEADGNLSGLDGVRCRLWRGQPQHSSGPNGGDRVCQRHFREDGRRSPGAGDRHPRSNPPTRPLPCRI